MINGPSHNHSLLRTSFRTKPIQLLIVDLIANKDLALEDLRRPAAALQRHQFILLLRGQLIPVEEQVVEL
jgi:hypothetical protein